jgi:hypothetical protein
MGMMMEASALRETYDRVILNSISLTPSAHNPRIIKCNDSHDINALCLETVQILNVAWQMFGTAARGEGAWDSKEDDFLVGPFCVGEDEGLVSFSTWLRVLGEAREDS